ncbi:MAG: alpha/beta fold hydrolase [Luteitalea sp.]|nr:alpha/beta fold hydrolase [Luteitalea sp.]
MRALLLYVGAVVVALVALKLLVLAVQPRFAFFPFRGEDITPTEHHWDYEAVTITTRDGERLRAWWLSHPAPRAQIVYFHGNGGNLSIWSDILIGIARRGFSLLAVDYRGYGLSTGQPSEQGLYADVDATIHYVTQHPRRADRPTIYWGRSLGATMAARAARVVQPDGLVLESGFPDVHALFARNPVMWSLAWLSSYRFPTARWLEGVTCPILALHGTADSVVPFRVGRELFDRITSPRKRFVAIDGGDHNDPTPRHAEHYWDAVEQLVAESTTSTKHVRPRTPDP